MARRVSLKELNKFFLMITEGTNGRKSFDMNCDQVKIIAGGNGAVTATMKVQDQHTNQGGFLHGGMAALLVDDVSGLALLTRADDNSIGVSVNMNIDYMKPCFSGTEIVIKATTDKVGKRLAFQTVCIYNRANGDLMVRGTHIKFL